MNPGVCPRVSCCTDAALCLGLEVSCVLNNDLMQHYNNAITFTIVQCSRMDLPAWLDSVLHACLSRGCETLDVEAHGIIF